MNYYADELMWLERCVMPQLKRLHRQEEAECRANHTNMENHLYESLCDILRNPASAMDKMPLIQGKVGTPSCLAGEQNPPGHARTRHT